MDKWCHECRRQDTHDPACPNSDPTNHVIRFKYNKGYADGRVGQQALSRDPSYLLGHGNGGVALEEAQNGHDPRFA